jgi:chromosome segregation ATPase
MKAAIVTVIVALFGLIGFLEWRNQSRRVQIRDQVTREATRENQSVEVLENLLEMEKSRLNELRRELARLQNLQLPLEAAETDRQIQDLTARTNELKTQLAQVREEAEITASQAQVYDQTQRLDQIAAELELENQIQAIDLEMVRVQNEIQNLTRMPATAENMVEREGRLRQVGEELAALRVQKEQRFGQIRGLSLTAEGTSLQVALQLAAEKRQISAEEANLSRQLADLQGNLNFWLAQKESIGQNQEQSAQRQAEIKGAIAAQETRIRNLESLIAALSTAQR